MFEDRIARVLEEGRSRQVDALVVMPGANLLYALGYRGKLSERISLGIISQRGGRMLFLPEVERTGAQDASPGSEIRTYRDEESPAATLQSLLRELGLRDTRVAVEYGAMRLLEYRLLQDALGGFETVDAGPIFAAVRVRKDEAELAAMRDAIGIAERALARVLPQLHAGCSEVEIAALLEMEMRGEGSEGTPFGTIVASGWRGALPHGRASDKPIEAGELVVLDFGTIYKGYVADITRTVSVGPVADEELRRAYRVLEAAQQTAREGIRPGRTAGEIDALARDVIDQEGFGPYFTHRTGHGLGLDDHEEPYIMRGSSVRLQPGMTFTVEPGIYLPGKGGIRIEDDMAVTEQGAESLTSYPRHLMEE